MYQYIICFLLFAINLSNQKTNYECSTLKLGNISSNRALTTLKALGYYVIEHKNIYAEGFLTNNFIPLEFNLDDVNGIYIVDIPDSQNQSLKNESEFGSDDFSKYLSGSSMYESTQSDPIERIMACYDKSRVDLYSQFLNVLYNQLDVSAKQILIEALVVEINSDDIQDTGISLDYLNQDEGLQLTTPTKDGLTALSMLYSENDFTELLYIPGDATDEGFFSYNTLEDIFKVKLNAIINDKSAEILSRPSVLVLDGRQARIQIGQQIPITKLAVPANSDADILISDVEYLPVGIVLNIKPRISNDLKSVTMQVETIITETEELSAGQVLDAPIINNRKVESQVKVLDNTPFIIGGLISNKKSNEEGRIPILSKIPILGKLFTWKTKQSIKKEVIVVITPHIINNNDDNFSRVIPQDETIFDSFDNILFPNSYRLKESDIYDLNFITESKYLNKIRNKANTDKFNNIDTFNLVKSQTLSQIKLGYIPGEKIITRRMIYDIIEKQKYFKAINSKKIIFFNNKKNYAVDYLKNYFSIINDSKKAILLLIDKDEQTDETFFRPGVNIKEIELDKDYNYKELLRKQWKLNPNYYPILISSKKDLKRLYEVLIMQEVLKLNSSLDLSISNFKRGLEIQFPAKELITNNSYVIDENIAKYFYDVNFYYENFENEFKSKTQFLNR